MDNKIQIAVLEYMKEGNNILRTSGGYDPNRYDFVTQFPGRDQEIATVVKALNADGYLIPAEIRGKIHSLSASGITIKGAGRLQQLKHPVRYFAKQHWRFIVTTGVALLGVLAATFNALTRIGVFG